MDRLTELVVEWEDRRAAGRPATPADLCPDDPALRSALADRVGFLERLDRLMATGPPDAGPPPPPVVPDRIGKYEIRGVLGNGGMGVVYDGWDPVLHRRAAVKVVHPRLVALAGDRAVARFAVEGRAVAQVDDRHVVRVYDAGADAGRHYLALEFVPGGTAAEHAGRLAAAGPRAVAGLMGKVAGAVEAAHRKGVLHRDLKPGNVLLDEAGEPKVVDFGLARLAAGDAPADPAADTSPVPVAALTTAGGPAPGTPPYMAPEQFDPALGPVGPGTDVWALGVILYELLTGRRPFPGPSRADFEAQVTRGPTPPPKGVPRRLAAVVRACLEKDPARRFRSAGDLAAALRAAVEPSRRGVLVTGLGASLACGLGYWRWGREAVPPDDEFTGYTDPAAARAAFARLERGEAVALIDGGPPATYRLNTGPTTGRGLTPPGGGWVLHSGTDFCACELLPRLPPGQWVIEADIRHERSAQTGGVGIYAGGTRGLTPAGLWVNLICPLTVDLIGNPATAAASLIWIRQSYDALQPHSNHYFKVAHLVPRPDAGARLTLGVSPAAVRPAANEVAFPPVTADRFEAARQAIVGRNPNLPAPPGVVTDFAGGVGLYVRAGATAVRRFLVRPVSPARGDG